MLKGRHLIEPGDFTIEELESIFGLADKIIANQEEYIDCCKGKLLASLFYEPSTRTRFSFESAMLRLGGKIIGFDNPANSSVSKGETIADTIRTVSCYADIGVIRHPREGTAKLVSKAVPEMPIINAGDGGHEHPTQTLTDLLTIRHEKGTCDGHVVGVCGDLLFGRTIHSLVKTLARYKDVKFVFISPKELKMPEYFLSMLEPGSYVETDNLDAVIGDLDILYMSRVQRERFVNEEEYLRLKDVYILDKKKMRHARSDMIVMHPLPRVNEIAVDVDADPRAVYFKQAKYGMYVRMALISKLLGVA
ncbi:aspartate carbamoyltransferase [Eubacterium aggregans]|uniref:Aspartate carbamoyltransferase n=1 Tax=Eubacterium aggregans TaxID=81409 RepID=A0A1H4CS15_9FIRM|nr:aspartate carbamoyltransferase [Eubacterium aggregans]MDD4692217.1 aspartate carbamoyltransferase [Eubacterium aggregans]SEA63155.1 aspartate carbamoyltransferase [Eubacterium aggregans]